MHQLNAQGTAADSERSLGVRHLGNAGADWRLLMRGAGFDKTVVAESSETQEQMNLMTSQGCHEGQGYLFGRPTTGNAIRAQREIPITLAQLVASIRAGRGHCPHPLFPLSLSAHEQHYRRGVREWRDDPVLAMSRCRGWPHGPAA